MRGKGISRNVPNVLVQVGCDVGEERSRVKQHNGE